MVRTAVSGIDPIVTNHFKMFFRDMLSQACDEVKSRNGFYNEFIVFMAVVMKRNRITVISINARGGDDRPAQITADIFYNSIWIAFVRQSTDIEAVFMV